MPHHLAAAYGYLDIVKSLQEAGADLCATTNGGLTAMDWAKAYGYVETSEFRRRLHCSRSLLKL
jgi:ankyrin repeat protein